MGNLQKLKHG